MQLKLYDTLTALERVCEQNGADRQYREGGGNTQADFPCGRHGIHWTTMVPTMRG